MTWLRTDKPDEPYTDECAVAGWATTGYAIAGYVTCLGGEVWTDHTTPSKVWNKNSGPSTTWTER